MRYIFRLISLVSRCGQTYLTRGDIVLCCCSVANNLQGFGLKKASAKRAGGPHTPPTDLHLQLLQGAPHSSDPFKTYYREQTEAAQYSEVSSIHPEALKDLIISTFHSHFSCVVCASSFLG